MSASTPPERPAPVSPSATVALDVPAGIRRPAVAAGALLVLAGCTVVAVGAGHVATAGGQPLEDGLIGLAGLVLVALGVLRLITGRTRDARLELWPDRMEIHFDAFLRGPVRIPRKDVRAAMVDAGAVEGGQAVRRDDERFAVLSDFAWHAPLAEPTNRGWLYTRSGGSILPLLGHPSVAPNLAVIFDEPVALPVRDGRRQRGPARLPRLGALTVGVLATSAAPASARGALDAWGCLRDLVESDFALDRPRAQVLGLHGDPAADAPIATPAGARAARRRGMLAVGAALGFAVAILAAALASLTGAWMLFEARRAPVVALVLAVVGVGLALMLVPRRLPVGDHGTVIGAVQHPRLFALVRQVAARAGVPPPDEVCIAPDVNAAVHETGGLRNRRVLTVGLPLVASLTERELAGVIAHEFGHFRGGDTGLGRLIARIDHHLTRAVAQLGVSGRWSIGGLVAQPPLAAFHRLFVRLTGDMMRHAEFSADALSAREVGTVAVSDTLTRIGGLAAAFDAFWQTEYEPAMRHGARPPLAMGFHRFCVQPTTRAFIAETGLRLLREEPRDLSGSHPPLRDRVAALRALDLPGAAGADGPALALLGDTGPVELSLLGSILPADALAATRESSWDEVLTHVHLTDWRAHFVAISDRIRGLTVADLPALASDPRALATRLGAQDPRALREDDAREGAVWTLGAVLTVALADHGFSVTAEPGGPVTASRERSRIRTFEAVRAMADGTIDQRDWVRHCRIEGVDTIPLAPDRFAFNVNDYPTIVDGDATA